MSRAVIIGTTILFVLFGGAYYVLYRYFIPHISPSDLTRNFFYKSVDERIQQFSGYSMEEQYDLLLYGLQVVHPRTRYLVEEFANQGPIIVPFLKTKLKTTTDEQTIYDIVLVFSELARIKRYDFSKDQELNDLLHQRASDIHDSEVGGMIFKIYWQK